ncbi:MAG: GFA family protein [Rhodobiaceae bacterium]|nr:GFA family protein [Rhodobiaceae bacterium]
MSRHTGSCMCGGVKIETEGEPMLVGHCHCLDCQKSSGAGHTTLALFADEQMEVTGALSHYESKTDSGNILTRSFCPTCGSRMIGKSTGMPTHTAIFLGVLDDSDALQPAMSFYAKRLRTWDHLAEGIPAFETLPPQP